jgi:hypothetical protein
MHPVFHKILRHSEDRVIVGDTAPEVRVGGGSERVAIPAKSENGWPVDHDRRVNESHPLVPTPAISKFSDIDRPEGHASELDPFGVDFDAIRADHSGLRVALNCLRLALKAVR